MLGTPTEATWPGVSRLPLYKPQRLNFYRTQRLGHAFPRLYDISQAENLASKLLQLQPSGRLTGETAVRHKFFQELPTQLFHLPDGKIVVHSSVLSLSRLDRFSLSFLRDRRVHLHGTGRRSLPRGKEVPSGRAACGPGAEKQGQILRSDTLLSFFYESIPLCKTSFSSCVRACITPTILPTVVFDAIPQPPPSSLTMQYLA